LKKGLLRIVFAFVIWVAVAWDCEGQTFPWAKCSVGNAISVEDMGYAISLDTNRNVFITGWFYSQFMTIGTTTLNNPTGQCQLFTAKYDSNGNSLWATKPIETISSGDNGYSITTDLSGNSFITGSFASPQMVFGTYTITNVGSSSIFLAKYDTNGNILWAKGFGGGIDDAGFSICTDIAGNVFVTGGFTSPSVVFGGYTLTNLGIQSAVFIAKFDSNGNVLWAKSAGGILSDYALSVSTDISGNAFIAGRYRSPTITFGATTFTNVGGIDKIFLTKYDGSGNVLWAKSPASTSNDDPSSINTDASGNVYMTGIFSSPSLAFGTSTLTNIGIANVFVAKYDANGNVLWAKKAGGTSADGGSGISSYTGGVYVSGDFNSPWMTFGTYTLISPLVQFIQDSLLNMDLTENFFAQQQLQAKTLMELARIN